EEAGLTKAETELAMGADLAALEPATPVPEALRIVRARTAEEIADFARVQAANWDPPDRLVLRFYELASAALRSADCPIRLYVGYLRAEPVAASELTLGGDAAGLFHVAPPASQRPGGIRAALTARPLHDGRELGYRTAVLQAAAEGVRLYERIGFRRFGDITEYKPRFS